MAATTHIWQGTTGDYATVGNWSTGSLPGTGGPELDTAICDGSSQVSFTTNLDRTADNELFRFVTTRKYKGDIGSSGNALLLDVAGVNLGLSRVVHQGSGQFFYKGESVSNCDVFVNSQRSLNSPAMTVDGNIRNIFVVRGAVEVLSTCNVTNVIIAIGSAAKVTMADRATTESIPVRIIATDGARIINYRETTTAAGNLLIAGPNGHIEQYGPVMDATLCMTLRGEIKYESDTALTSSHNPDLYALGGLLDLSESVYDVEWDDMVIGPMMQIAGSMLNVSDEFSPLATQIDMRTESP